MNANEAAAQAKAALEEKGTALIEAIKSSIETAAKRGEKYLWTPILGSTMSGNQQRLISYLTEQGYVALLEKGFPILLEIGRGPAWTLIVAWGEKEKYALAAAIEQKNTKYIDSLKVFKSQSIAIGSNAFACDCDHCGAYRSGAEQKQKEEG